MSGKASPTPSAVLVEIRQETLEGAKLSYVCDRRHISYSKTKRDLQQAYPGEFPARRFKVPRQRRRPPSRDMSKPKHPTTQRPCLRCGKAFPSEGPHHRLCEKCREHWDREPSEPVRGRLHTAQHRYRE